MVEVDEVVEVEINEIEKLRNDCIKHENKLNEVITMVNQLIVNVNAANQFIASLHNALADAGLVKKPEEIIKDIKEGNIPEEVKDTMIHSKQIASIDVGNVASGDPTLSEPEPEMDNAD
jgi:hypothetical protein